jgi:hypothetical protein
MPIIRFAFLMPAFAYFISFSMVQGEINLYSGYEADRQYAIGDFIAVESVDNNVTYRVDGDSSGNVPPIGTPVTDTNYFTSLADETPDEGPTEARPEAPSQAVQNSQPGVPGGSLGGSKIVRMSVRGHIGSGDDERFMRLAVSGNVNVMVRAIGPSLGDLDSSLAHISLLNPEMFISDSNGNQLTSNNNDDYIKRSEFSQIESISNSLSVVIPIKDIESASIADYSSGTYFINVRDKSYSSSYGTRIGWVGADITDTNASGGFTGVSTRGVIKPDSGSMFASFEIVGDANSTRKIFIRARGASLANLGVSNVLSNISFKLFKLGGVEPELIDWNNNYKIDNTNYQEIASQALSFYGALDDTDAGLILDLKPAYYSIWAQSETGSTGVGWVGIDDITP